MHGTSYDALVAFILSIDRSILTYLLPIDLCFSVAAVAMLSRGRRPLELFALFVLSFLIILFVAWVVFHGMMGRPFYRLEVISYP